jgi:hypothetical protein
MRVGTVIGFQNPAAWRQSWAELYAESLEFAARADVLGFDEVWLTEHHFSDDGYSPALMPIAAAIAARTRSIRIGTKDQVQVFATQRGVADQGSFVGWTRQQRRPLVSA